MDGSSRFEYYVPISIGAPSGLRILQNSDTLSAICADQLRLLGDARILSCVLLYALVRVFGILNIKFFEPA